MRPNYIRYSDTVCFGISIVFFEELPLPKRWNPNDHTICATPKTQSWRDHLGCDCWNYYLKRKEYFDSHLKDDANHWIIWNRIYPEMFPVSFMLNIEKQNRRINAEETKV